MKTEQEMDESKSEDVGAKNEAEFIKAYSKASPIIRETVCYLLDVSANISQVSNKDLASISLALDELKFMTFKEMKNRKRDG